MHVRLSGDYSRKITDPVKNQEKISMKSNAVKILDKFRLENIPIEIININAMGKQ